MALQNRYGEFKDFDPNKMVTAELAVVVSGDPASPTGRTMYVCFAPGVVKRITTYEDFENELQNATEEIRKEFTEDIQTAIENSIAATTAANAAKEAADRAAEAANAAAEAAGAYVLGDISEKTVTFETAAQRAGIESGDSLSVAFGKLAKFCTDLDQHAFNPLANNLTTNTEGYGIDARQGPVIDKKISDVKTEVSELNTKIARFDESCNIITSNPLVAETVGTYTQRTISGLSNYKRVKMLVAIGDAYLNWLEFDKTQALLVVNGYASASWCANVEFQCELKNNLIGLKVKTSTGWTASQSKIISVVAIEKE